ncbi:hypothetical protein [Buttiauxella sp. 3AFRM03]|uniref:hypothetical protein n=1 Tax=Buttiauxella sp. 3AFRM03 TaxID=2479367 RepID=UPI00138FA728|nr:hypothetical protein [Buttiauxella sp. 3AFRM03]
MFIVTRLKLRQAQSDEQIIGEGYVQRRATAYPPLFMATPYRLRCKVFPYTPTVQVFEALAARFRGLTLSGTVSHVKRFLSDKSKHCGQ